jgi:hypothetical protein
MPYLPQPAERLAQQRGAIFQPHV